MKIGQGAGFIWQYQDFTNGQSACLIRNESVTTKQ